MGTWSRTVTVTWALTETTETEIKFTFCLSWWADYFFNITVLCIYPYVKMCT